MSGRNIVICADGTGKSPGGRVTNVIRLVGHLDMDDAARQVVAYDPGVGSRGGRSNKLADAHPEAVRNGALIHLPPPDVAKVPGVADLRLGLHQALGIGIRRNVDEMYAELTRLYAGPEDSVFLFGFSRGAFTVQTLAGLLYRCGLPPREAGDADERFARAWAVYQSSPPSQDVARFRATQRDCPVVFMGLWDTVSSYGGPVPRLLPHLRHNPVVVSVRHALALDERRAFFTPTTWGRLASDEGVMGRFPPDGRQIIERQDIREVWFAGSHSDVGGDYPEDAPPDAAATDPARVALRWMIGEAVNVNPPVRLSRSGRDLLAEDDPPPGSLRVSDSWRGVLRWAEVIPRLEIDHSREWPEHHWTHGNHGPRSVPASARRGEGAGGETFISVHETVSLPADPGVTVVRVRTRRAPG